MRFSNTAFSNGYEGRMCKLRQCVSQFDMCGVLLEVLCRDSFSVG